MARPRALRIVLLSASDTLPRLGPALRSAGLIFHRVTAIESRACPPRVLQGPTPTVGPIDTVVVTSRHAVGRALRAWTRPARDGAVPEVWAVGAGTAARLRHVGVRQVHRGAGPGTEAIVRRFGRRARTVVHLRSDVAGDTLARTLRARGHRVVEVVAYRVRPALSEIRRRRATLRRADAVVLTSPSVVHALRSALGPARTRAWARSTPAAVLGERTARAARAAGFTPVEIAPATPPQRFARLLVRTVLHARA